MIKTRAHQVIVDKEIAGDSEKAKRTAQSYADGPIMGMTETPEAYHFHLRGKEDFQGGSIQKYPGEHGVHVLKGSLKGDASNQRVD